MSQDQLTQLQTADLLLRVSVQVLYGKNNEGNVSIKTVSVVHGPLSLDITALLTEDDFYDVFEQIHDWYDESGPLGLFAATDGEPSHD
jgi:hypothetical protein